uniref:Uncharacterized protein n=1 Tax=Chenopodium quinoa TaxID=63459 RepID=A0A803N6M4_CHEQI
MADMIGESATPSSVNPSSDDPLTSTTNSSQPKPQDNPPDSEAQIPTERALDDLGAPKKADVCGDSKSGTSVMKNHILRCKEYPANIDKSQRLLSLKSELTEQVKRDGSVDDNMSGTFVNGRKGRLDLWIFKQDECRKAFAKMVIMDEKTFRCCEHDGFHYFMQNIQYVKWAMDDQYDLDKGKELYDKIMDALYSLYEHYASQQTQSGSSPSNMVDLTTRDMESFEDWHDMAYFGFERDIGSQSNLEKKNDLDKYLHDEREPNTIGKSFDALECSLSSNMVEALICAQDWLRNTRGPLVVEENLEDIERLEEELSPLIEQPSSGVVDDYIVFGPAALPFAFYLSYSTAAALMLFAWDYKADLLLLRCSLFNACPSLLLLAAILLG